ETSSAVYVRGRAGVDFELPIKITSCLAASSPPVPLEPGPKPAPGSLPHPAAARRTPTIPDAKLRAALPSPSQRESVRGLRAMPELVLRQRLALGSDAAPQ